MLKSYKKLSALSRVSKYMGINKKRILMKSYIFSQFNYCPLVWMCHSRSLNNKIHRVQERALRMVCRDKKIRLIKKINQSLSTRKTYGNL